MCHKVALPELPAVLTLRRSFSKEDAQFFCKKPSALQADFLCRSFTLPHTKRYRWSHFTEGIGSFPSLRSTCVIRILPGRKRYKTSRPRLIERIRNRKILPKKSLLFFRGKGPAMTMPHLSVLYNCFFRLTGKQGEKDTKISLYLPRHKTHSIYRRFCQKYETKKNARRKMRRA